MNLNFKNVIKQATSINAQHVKAIKIVARQRIYRMIYLDDRTTGFNDIKPFAADQDNYYVCCPCCLQIEQIKAADFKGGSTLNIHCKSTKNSQMYCIDTDGSSIIGYKMMGYSVNLKGWKPEDIKLKRKVGSNGKDKVHTAFKAQDVIENSC